jgi:hypothetical protein
MPKQFKITYSTLGANLDVFHRQYDKAVDVVKEKFGKTYPHLINNRSIRGRGAVFASTNPADTRMVLANFRQATEEEMDAAVEAARQAFRLERDGLSPACENHAQSRCPHSQI